MAEPLIAGDQRLESLQELSGPNLEQQLQEPIPACQGSLCHKVQQAQKLALLALCLRLTFDSDQRSKLHLVQEPWHPESHQHPYEFQHPWLE